MSRISVVLSTTLIPISFEMLLICEPESSLSQIARFAPVCSTSSLSSTTFPLPINVAGVISFARWKRVPTTSTFAVSARRSSSFKLTVPSSPFKLIPKRIAISFSVFVSIIKLYPKFTIFSNYLSYNIIFKIFWE